MLRTTDGSALTKPMRLCVSNTHLSWNPEYADVKLWQTHMLVKELEKFTISRQLPLVLCGDLNSSTTTAVHHLLAGTRGGNCTHLCAWPIAPAALPPTQLTLVVLVHVLFTMAPHCPQAPWPSMASPASNCPETLATFCAAPRLPTACRLCLPMPQSTTARSLSLPTTLATLWAASTTCGSAQTALAPPPSWRSHPCRSSHATRARRCPTRSTPLTMWPLSLTWCPRSHAKCARQERYRLRGLDHVWFA